MIYSDGLILTDKELNALDTQSINIIDKFIIHCSDSDHKYHDDIAVINQWHKDRGWICVGYHFFITKKGVVQRGRPIRAVGAHCKGHNLRSIGICLSGKHDFSPIQFDNLLELCHDIVNMFFLESTRSSPFEIYHHHDFDSNKTCPNFDLKRDAKIFKESENLKNYTDFLRPKIYMRQIEEANGK